MAFNPLERKALVGLALLYMARMLGLFMVLPVLTYYGQNLQGANSVTLGIAIGIYGLTQALLQIPYGAASDRFGRKPLIAVGLLVFLLGSVLAALADHVLWVIVGRAMQGAGAISSVVLAMLADYTRPQERSKSMAVIGAVIGSSFILAVIIGPVVVNAFNLDGLFWFTAMLSLVGMLVLWWLPAVPETAAQNDRKFERSAMLNVIADKSVLVFSVGVLVLHLTMTSLFVVLPVLLITRGFEAENFGWLYAPVMLVSFLAMAPMMMFSERLKQHSRFLKVSVGLILLAWLMLVGSSHPWVSLLALVVYFAGFNFIEATLPSLLSRKVSENVRGTAMGVFSACQFLGAALGGILGGWLFLSQELLPVALFSAALTLIWGALLFLVKKVSDLPEEALVQPSST